MTKLPFFFLLLLQPAATDFVLPSIVRVWAAAAAAAGEKEEWLAVTANGFFVMRSAQRVMIG